MSLLSEMKEHTAERRVRSNHPILSLPVNRDVSEAYFEMLVFASVADNGKKDDEERVHLEKVGLALGMSSAEVNEIANNFTSIDDKGRVFHAAAAADALKGSGVADLLLCEFSQVWASHNHDISELMDMRKQFAEWMDVRYDDEFFAVFDDVSAHVKDNPSAAYALCDYLDDVAIRYLFADIFDIEKIFAEKREAEVRAVVPHPLKPVLNDAQKAHYLSALRCYVEITSDNSPAKIQLKGLRHLAVALGTKDVGDPEDESKLVLSLDSGTRTVGFFFYCDMARLFAMDGSPTFSAIQNQMLEATAASFKMASEDVEFLKRYSAYLGNGNEPDAAEVVRDAQGAIRFPDGFIRYFTPNMKPIVLAGGDTPAGVYQIVDGHYRLKKPLTVCAQTRLIIKNAIIDFAPEAEIELGGKDVAISDTVFNGEKAEIEELIAKPFFSASGFIKFERCVFNGASCRAFIESSSSVNIRNCKLNSLIGNDKHAVIECRYSGVLDCVGACWTECLSSNCLVVAEKAWFGACDFVNCTTGAFARTYSDCYLTIVACLFEGCLCNSGFVMYEEYDSDRRAKIEDNSLLNSEGIDMTSSVTHEKLREAREILKMKIERDEVWWV